MYFFVLFNIVLKRPHRPRALKSKIYLDLRKNDVVACNEKRVSYKK
jgi:hypothetical protein